MSPTNQKQSLWVLCQPNRRGLDGNRLSLAQVYELIPVEAVPVAVVEKQKSLESWLWDTACSIRGAREAANNKNFILLGVVLDQLPAQLH